MKNRFRRVHKGGHLIKIKIIVFPKFDHIFENAVVRISSVSFRLHFGLISSVRSRSRQTTTGLLKVSAGSENVCAVSVCVTEPEDRVRAFLVSDTL